jgi:hypothetical protein
MDLLIWAVPLFSLVGGATGAAIINNMFGIRKQKADRVEEHDRWLRNEKVEAYAGFVDAALEAYNKAPLLQPRDVARIAQALQESSLPLSRILLVADDDVHEAARAAANALSDFVQDAVRYEDGDPQRSDQMDKHGGIFIQKLKTLQELCRLDLGVPKLSKK